MLISSNSELSSENYFSLEESKICRSWGGGGGVINPSPIEKTVALANFKTFADDSINVTQHIKIVFHMIESIEGK